MSTEWLRPGEQRATRILILGGGFAGVYAGFELQRACAGQHVEISIVNRENFYVFYPLLPEIISGAIEVENVLNPIRLVVPKASLYVGEVTAIDLAQARVEIRHGLYRHKQEERTLLYDHLIVALGGVPATSRIPGLAEHAFDVQRLSSAFALRNHLIDTLEQGDIETDPLRKRRILSYVVVGGGTNGVEVAGEMHALLHEACRYYPQIEPEDIRVVIVQSADRLFPDLPKRLADFAARLLRQRGVEIIFGHRVARVEPGVVFLDDGRTIEADTIVGSVGVETNPLVSELPLPHDPRGRLAVRNTLGAGDEFPNVWAIGDAARVIDPHTGQPYPQTAQHAVREARLVARNIAATLRGEQPEPMTYRTLGQLVALGHRSAVAYIPPLKLSGFLAWWIWRTYYLLQIPRWEKRLRVMFDWTLDLVFPPELVQLKVGQPVPSAGRSLAGLLGRRDDPGEAE